MALGRSNARKIVTVEDEAAAFLLVARYQWGEDKDALSREQFDNEIDALHSLPPNDKRAF
ncbi:hypothetical protein OC844_006859, partial [Tilletia horrida]